MVRAIPSARSKPAQRQSGCPPSTQRAKAQKRLAASRVPTLRDATADYLARPKLRSETNKKAVHRQMHFHLKNWLDLPLDEISRDMCKKMHATLTKRCAIEKRANDGTVAANQILKSFRTIHNFARKSHDLPEVPTSAIEWHEENPLLTIIEDFEKWKAEVAAVENEVHRAFYYFLLLTGLRKTEAATLLWANVHDDHVHLPMTKNGRPFNLPPLLEHHAILEPLRKFAGDYVFPATDHHHTCANLRVCRGRRTYTATHSQRSRSSRRACLKKQLVVC